MTEKLDNSAKLVESKAGGGVFREDASEGEVDMATLTNAKLNNPLTGIEHSRLMEMGAAYAKDNGLESFVSEFEKGALVAQNPEAFESLDHLDESDKTLLRREMTHKWSQPKILYLQTICCSAAAAVQGMDESVINGALLFWPNQFGLYQTTALVTAAFPGISESAAAAAASQNQWLVGVTTAAPYICCATIGCWMTDPMNARLGRRGTIFLTAFISFITVIWSALTNTWWHLLISRFFLGFGIGPKSATVPVYAAECAPANIRGALVMQWQVWTAFGIMLGTVADLAFLNVRDPAGIVGLNWRLMLGSAALPAVFVMAQVFFMPESPRWLISKGRHADAFASLCRLRNSPLQAARDLFFIHALLEEESANSSGRNGFYELFAIPRNRRAALASGIVMFMQQLCGINVIAYYSSTIFVESGFTEIAALGASLGFSTLNFLFAAPAIWTIDTFGRRFLLLTTFPLMSLFLLMTGMAFFIPDVTSRIGVVALSIYLFVIAYSPGEGPIPFTYSAEAFPLYVRELGMSYATAVTWGFNSLIAITFPRLLGAFKPQGAFGFYAVWNFIGWWLILLFVPETKALTLEELDQVFNVPTRQHASYQFRQIPYIFNRYVLRRDVGPQEMLYAWEKNDAAVVAGTTVPTTYAEKGEDHA